MGAALNEAFFEPEAITQGGLFSVAMPVLMLLFLLHTFGDEELRPAEHHPPPPSLRAAVPAENQPS